MLAMIGQVLPEPFWQRVTPAPVDALEGPSRLLLDSRVVDVPMSYHPIVMTLSSVTHGSPKFGGKSQIALSSGHA